MYSLSSALEFGPGNGTIWIDNVDCSGDEDSLNECDIDWMNHHTKSSCSHNDDAGVICSPIEGNIKQRENTKHMIDHSHSH